MKANQKIKNMKNNDQGYTKVVGGLVALMLMIIVGIMVFWETFDSIDAFDSVTETFTTDTDGNTFTQWAGGTSGSNYTGEVIELDNSPNSITSVVAWNGTGSTVAEQTVTAGTQYTTSHTLISIVAGQLTNFTQLNVTYTSEMASSGDGATDMATTVFGLMPIIALAVVASIILMVIVGFGSSRKGGL